MFGAVNIEDVVALGKDDPLYKEFFGDPSWRILPEDAIPQDKFVADMKLIRLDSEMFPGSKVAHGRVYNDSRGIFRDGDVVRTSVIKDIYEKDGHIYIETRNTMYRLVDGSEGAV
jgi:hypothetical protein